jgi:hypothetical protein
MGCKRVPSLSVLGVASVMLLSADALAADPCTGHKLLRTPRPESSCSNVKPRIYPSPDGTSRALVYPVDISLNATPDMESRIVIRSNKGETLTSKDYASPRGFTVIMSSAQSGRPTRSSSFTACRLRAVIRPGNFRSRYTAAPRIASGNSAI